MEILLYVYLLIGLIYGLYMWLFGTDQWYWLPVNVVFGPILMVYIFLKTTFGKKLP